MSSQGKETFISEFFSLVSTLSALILTGYGTVVMSSLLFISVRDASIVAARFLAGTVICKFLVIFELSGIRYVMLQERDASTDEQIYHAFETIPTD
jgi:hypothetical protein